MTEQTQEQAQEETREQAQHEAQETQEAWETQEVQGTPETREAREPQRTSEPEPPVAAPALAPAPAPAPDPAPAPGKDRRLLRAVLRWTAAVTVFAAFGAGTAYGITSMERTDVPGLATEPDGRWDYPVLTRPPLPSGSPGPFAEGNRAGAHYADLRALVLPAPRGAREDKALRGSDGWLATRDFLAEYSDRKDRAELGQRFADSGLRHIAARGWTTEDGTRTRVYLLQFGTAEVADQMQYEAGGANTADRPVRGAQVSRLDASFPLAAKVENVSRYIYGESRPYGEEQVRHAYLLAGDVLAMIVQSREGAVAAVPFQQTVTLQSELLG
ncbi:hypothetical protein [Streptomyces sp. NPDC004065]|uniref:hypothetical protein n=1 Tax=Streptomyces sp. NPDC004065 TaxID=3364689 RepID=UPI00384C8CB7